MRSCTSNTSKRELPPLTNEQQKIVAENMKLVPWVVTRSFRSALDYEDMDDLISVGYIGLIYAARAYNPSRGAKFSPYAKQWITCAIYRYVIRNMSDIKIPLNEADKLTDEDIKKIRFVKIDGLDVDSDDCLPLLEDKGAAFEDFIASKIDVENLISRQTDVRQEILKDYFRSDDTFRSVASRHGVSWQRVRQIVVDFREQALE